MRRNVQADPVIGSADRRRGGGAARAARGPDPRLRSGASLRPGRGPGAGAPRRSPRIQAGAVPRGRLSDGRVEADRAAVSLGARRRDPLARDLDRRARSLPDGRYRTRCPSMAPRPARRAAGPVAGGVAVVLDITARRRAGRVQRRAPTMTSRRSSSGRRSRPGCSTPTAAGCSPTARSARSRATRSTS